MEGIAILMVGGMALILMAYAATAIATAVGLAFLVWRLWSLAGRLITFVNGTNNRAGYYE